MVSFYPDNSSINDHLKIVQEIISRMSRNSSACKTWCITIVAAILVILSDNISSNHVFISAVPIFLFCYLDAYYLDLERRFRTEYNYFVKKLHEGSLDNSEIFNIGLSNRPVHQNIYAFIKSIGSPSVWPFYSILIISIVLIKILVLKS